MATLEVHDAQGRVQFIELTRDHPVLFGTSAACDVILDGPGIRPVHGRIRWKGKRYKVEASPDAEYVLVNGTRMTASSIRQGDEIGVGPCSMFLMRVDEPVPRKRPKDGPGGERTPLMPAPVVPVEAERERLRHARHGRSSSQRGRESVLERADWLDVLKGERPETEQEPAALPGGDRASAARSPRRTTAQATTRPRLAWPALVAWLKALHASSAPGKERIASSPLVLSLVAALAILVGMGFWLKSIIAATLATRAFNSGMQDFEDGDYRTAMRNFDSFLATNPQDARSGKARVLRAFANVRQYVSREGATWSAALEAAQDMVEQHARLPEFRDEQVDLADVILKIGEGLADRARSAADPTALAEAESTIALHARVGGQSAADFLNRSRLPSKLTQARAAVLKAQVYSRALGEMDSALGEGVVARVYQARDDLVDRYADLSRDRAVLERMTAANELVRKAVRVDPTRRPAVTEPKRDCLGPPTSLVLRDARSGPAEAPSADMIVYAVADGHAYALDGPSGTPLWHNPVGSGAPFVPRSVPGDGTVLAFDARANELLRLEARTGSLKWRFALDEPIRDPPLVFGNQLAQVLPSGKLLLLDLNSGELLSSVNLGRPLARAPVLDELGQHLYVLGRRDCLFILARDPLGCVGVEYLGHADLAIPCPPARVGRFLVVPENDTLSESRWHILVLDEAGTHVRPVQEVAISGWTRDTPASSGSIVWATGDKGGYEAFAVGDYTGRSPFRSIARIAADASPSGPAFALATSERELWVASGHTGHFTLDPQRESIQPKLPLPQPGPALAPIQVAGSNLIFTFQDQETGGVALMGVDAESGSIVWRTVLGARWPTPLTASSEPGALTAIGRDGSEVSISKAHIARGGFVVLSMPAPGAFALPAGSRLEIQGDGKRTAALVPHPPSDLVWIQQPDKRPGWRKLVLPTALAAEPLFWGGGILVPGSDARVYLIDTVTARSRAEPFVPKFDRDHQGTWLAPVLLSDGAVGLADDVGRVRRIALRTAPVPRLMSEADATLDQRIIADPASTGGAVIIATADRRVRALAVRDLSPVGSWELAAPLAEPPIGTAGFGFVLDRAGGVMAFARDGHRAWSINLGAEVVGLPLVRDRSVWFLTRDGTLHERGLSDGAGRTPLALGVLPGGGILETGASPVIAAGRGTFRLLAEQPAAPKSP
jgi:outer membrane protein assembly factor BamB